MPNLVGVIHPHAFQPSQIMGKISKTYEKLPASTPFRFYRSKNLEVGCWNLEIGSNPKKEVWAFFSGTIQNKEALKQLLKEKGVVQKIESDVQLLVYAYDAWGDSFIQHIDGSFFIVLFDEKKQQLLLVLDRMGQKSLYWSDQGDYFLFSTDIKGLLGTGLVSQNPSVTALSSYLYFGYIPQDLSAFQGVNKLLPGNLLKVTLSKHYHMTPYWSLSKTLSEKKEATQASSEERFGELLHKKIHEEFKAHENLTIHATNHLGSALLQVESSHQIPPQNLRSLSVHFAEKESDEKQFVENVQTHYPSQLTYQPITLDETLDELPKLVWYLDEPLADLGVLKTWNLAKKMKENGGTLISDAGFDELFALHHRYFASWQLSAHFNPSFLQNLAHLSPKIRDRWVRPFLSFLHPPWAFRLLRNIDIDYTQVLYLNHIALFKGACRKFASPSLYPYFEPEVFSQRFHRLSTLPDQCKASIYFDLKTSLPDSILFQQERLFPLMGVKTSHPYLSHEFLDFTLRLPHELFKEKNQRASFIPTYIENKELKIDLPQQIPYSFPKQWQHSKRLRKIFSLLRNGRLVEDEFISSKWIQAQLSPSQLTPLATQQLWSILILEIWFRLFVTAPVDTINPEETTEQLLER